MRPRASATLAALSLGGVSCGAGVITADDVSGGEAVIIGAVVVVGVLFVMYVGTKRR